MAFLGWIIGFIFIFWLYIRVKVSYGIVASIIFFILLYKKKFAGICIIFAYRKYAEGKFADSFKWFERAYKHGMNLRQKVTYSYYLLREGRVERAEEVLNSILAFNQKDEDKYLAKSHHALVLMKTGREDEAFEELSEIFPYYKNTTMYGSLGYLYVICKPFGEAEKFNLEAYDYNSDDAVILDNIVQLYVKYNLFDKAFSYAEKIMEKEPKFIEAYYNAALAAKGMQKYDLAREYLKKTENIQTSFLSNISHDDVNKLLEELPA